MCMNLKGRLDAVLFDLDGVLVDACDWHYEALNRALSKTGHKKIDKESHLTTFNGLPTRIKLDMLGISPDRAHEINQLKQRYTLETIRERAHIMTEKESLHSYLRNGGVKIACVTNSIRETAEAMLLATGQLRYMDLIVTNEDVEKNKPSPDCYNHATKVLGVDPSLCLCVEDSPKGVEAAESSWVKHVWKVGSTEEVTVENLKAFLKELL